MRFFAVEVAQYAQALKILGMQGEERFDKYHRVLSRASWNPLEGGKILLKQLMNGMIGPLVIAIDEHGC